jgi:hypothetical protein
MAYQLRVNWDMQQKHAVPFETGKIGGSSGCNRRLPGLVSSEMHLQSMFTRRQALTTFAGFCVAPVMHAQSTRETLSLRRIPGLNRCMAVEVRGKRLYAIGQGELHVYDISVPEVPRLMGKLSGLGNTRQIFILDSIAYITSRQDGLFLVDVKADDAPRLISHYDTVEMATGIWVSGAVAFVATRCYGVELVDVSDANKPRHLSTLKTGEAQSCWARDGFLYIGDWHPKKLLVADVRDPHHPRLVGEGELDGYGDGGCLRGNYVFAATGHHSRNPDKEAAEGMGHGLEILDVSDPRKPVRVSAVKFPKTFHITNDMWSAKVSGDHCVVADTWNGVFVVDIKDLTRPQAVAHVPMPKVVGEDKTDACGGIALGEGVIYVAGVLTGLHVASAKAGVKPVILEKDVAPNIPPISREPHPMEARFIAHRPEGQVRSAALDREGVIWVACGVSGIQALRIEGNGLQVLSRTLSKEGLVVHVAIREGFVYAAESWGGLVIYEKGKDHQLKEIGRIKIPNKTVKQVSCPDPGRFALIHGGNAEVQVVDLKDPQNPKVVLQDKQVGLFYGDQLIPELVGGKYLVAFWQRSGPGWYDVSGETPRHLGNLPDPVNFSWSNGACSYKDGILVTHRGQLQFVQAGDLTGDSRKIVVSKDRRYGGRPSTNGRRLTLSYRDRRHLEIFDFSNSNEPKLTAEYDLEGHPAACVFHENRVIVPAGYQGLLIEKV